MASSRFGFPILWWVFRNMFLADPSSGDSKACGWPVVGLRNPAAGHQYRADYYDRDSFVAPKNDLRYPCVTPAESCGGGPRKKLSLQRKIRINGRPQSLGAGSLRNPCGYLRDWMNGRYATRKTRISPVKHGFRPRAIFRAFVTAFLIQSRRARFVCNIVQAENNVDCGRLRSAVGGGGDATFVSPEIGGDLLIM